MKDYDIFCDAVGNKLEDVKREIQTKGLTDASLEYLHKLTDTKKNLMKIEKLEMELGGMSAEMPQGNSFRPMMNVPMGNSYASNQYGRSYDSYRGNSNNSYGYSMGGSDSYDHLEAAMRSATSDAERDAIRQLMSKLYK